MMRPRGTSLAKATLFLPLLLFANLHSLSNAIGLARVDGLAGLLDLLEYGAVIEALVGLDGSGLGVEGDVKFFDTYKGEFVSEVLREEIDRPLDERLMVRLDLPSSFFSTRSTAPEQPPQVMVMLNL
jgi:hypothetical protein